MTAARQKRHLRRQYRQLRCALTAARQRSHALAVARAFIRSPLLWRVRHLGAYLATDGELNPMPLMQQCWARGLATQLPALVPDWRLKSRTQRMLFRPFGPGTELCRHRFGLWQPARPVPAPPASALLMPLVAFDSEGSRLGMGGGYYDRWVAGNASTWRIGLAHDCQRTLHPLPREAWDAQLDAVITESGWHPFSDRAHRLQAPR